MEKRGQDSTRIRLVEAVFVLASLRYESLTPAILVFHVDIFDGCSYFDLAPVLRKGILSLMLLFAKL